MNVLIAGIGSFDSADQAGWIMTDKLQQLQAPADAFKGSQLCFIKSNNPAALLGELQHRPEHYGQLMVLDAIEKSYYSDQIVMIEYPCNAGLVQNITAWHSSHAFSLTETLRLAQSLRSASLIERMRHVSWLTYRSS